MSSILPSDLIAPFLRGPRPTEADAIEWTWKETPNSHIFKFDLPGYSKSDIDINIHTDTRVLHITTKTDKKIEEDEVSQNVTWHCRERMGSSVGGGKIISKQFRLPKDARIDGISASMKDGVLVVTVPKESSFCDESGKSMEEEVKKRRRSVEIEGKDDEDRRGSGRGGGVLGINCFVCFKS